MTWKHREGNGGHGGRLRFRRSHSSGDGNAHIAGAKRRTVVERDVSDRVQITCHGMHTPDSCAVHYLPDDELLYTIPHYNPSRVRGRETSGRSGRCEGTAEATLPSVERKQRNVCGNGGSPRWEIDMPM
jgi:hypothetical protein